jgi:hypothetical protein
MTALGQPSDSGLRAREVFTTLKEVIAFAWLGV